MTLAVAGELSALRLRLLKSWDWDSGVLVMYDEFKSGVRSKDRLVGELGSYIPKALEQLTISARHDAVGLVRLAVTTELASYLGVAKALGLDIGSLPPEAEALGQGVQSECVSWGKGRRIKHPLQAPYAKAALRWGAGGVFLPPGVHAGGHTLLGSLSKLDEKSMGLAVRLHLWSKGELYVQQSSEAPAAQTSSSPMNEDV
jgi:hypothetical protein